MEEWGMREKSTEGHCGERGHQSLEEDQPGSNRE